MSSRIVRSSCILVLLAAGYVAAQSASSWKIHDENRPEPRAITPGRPGIQEAPGQPPSDATVLLGGKDLSEWVTEKGEPAKWKFENGVMEVVPRGGTQQTRQSFGDCQLHVEWASPAQVRGTGQDRGNSGVFLMGKYEVQVLDSYQAKTYVDGQASAVYGQYPPLVNACLPPGQWQTYDIIFHRPRWDASGKLTRRARVTVLHNGVLVQDNVELTGPTGHKARPAYEKHADALPIALQDHGHPVRYRNIWIRPLSETEILPVSQ